MPKGTCFLLEKIWKRQLYENVLLGRICFAVFACISGVTVRVCMVSRFSCVSLNPMNSSPPGSSVHGILQARSGLLYPPPGDLPDPGIEPASCIAGGFLTADATSPSGIIRPLQTKQCPVKTGKARNQSSHCYGLSMLLPYMGCSIWRWGIRLKAQLFRLEGVKQLEMSLITLHVSRPSK